MASKHKLQVPLVCHGHSRPIVDLNYSPVTDDGYFLASGSKDGKPMIRNGETGDWIGTFEGHKGCVWSTVLNTPALKAATGSADFSARVWDALTGDELHSFQHKHIVRCVAWSPDSSLLLTGGMEKLLRIYDLGSPDREPFVMEGSPSGVRCALWFGSSNQLVLSSCTDTGGLKLWDTRTLAIARTLDTAAPVTSIELSADGRYLTTADGPDVKFWDASTFQVVKSHTFHHPTESASLCLAKRRFVAAGADMWVRLMNFDTGEELETLKGHHGPVHCVRFGPTGDNFCSGSEDGTIRLWRTDAADEISDQQKIAANGT